MDTAKMTTIVLGVSFIGCAGYASEGLLAKTVAIIQSRLGSTRLPRKAFALLDERPLIEHVIRRVRKIEGIDQVVIATTNKSEDDALTEMCGYLGVPVFRGSSQDVLSRYYRCAIAFDADNVVRVTGDCPLLDPWSATVVLSAFLEGDDDYVSNTPDVGTDGWDTEAMTFRALRRAHREATDPVAREHVTPYIRNNPEKFHVGFVVPARIPGDVKLSVDTQEDLDRVRTLLEKVAA